VLKIAVVDAERPSAGSPLTLPYENPCQGTPANPARTGSYSCRFRYVQHYSNQCGTTMAKPKRTALYVRAST